MVPRAQLDALARMARAVAERAYAPYSHFRVGAAVLLDNGETICGCNVENASYRLTTCAEQNAIAASVARFGPGVRVLAVAICNVEDAACAPCGACRQTLAEFAGSDADVIFPGPAGTTEHCTIGELLPARFAFAPDRAQ